MLYRVALLRTDDSEERSASIITVTRIGAVGTTLAVTSNARCEDILYTANVVLSSPILVSLVMEVLRSSQTSVLSTATLRNAPEDGILHSHLHESLKSHK
jgi:hypothetical protein